MGLNGQKAEKSENWENKRNRLFVADNLTISPLVDLFDEFLSIRFVFGGCGFGSIGSESASLSEKACFDCYD
ncbi:hypothetical protein AAHA92_21729 [Salvia divinorum]|uniref:Uncharacterized protein n=1 Tax=Salvia divinorum TaxID=28513 RepID=A0ABD1GPH1_SALDI